MATPIPLELPPRDPRTELQQRLQNAPLEHAEAMLSLYEVVQGLHDSGTLEMLRGFLGSKDKVLEIIVETAQKPESIRAMRNLIIMAKVAGSIDPEVLKGIAQTTEEVLSLKAPAEPLSLWRLFKKLRSRNSRRALTAMTSILESTGRQLDSTKH